MLLHYCELTGLARDAEAIRPPHRLAVVLVDFDELDGVKGGEENRHKPAGTGFAFVIHWKKS